MNIRERIAGFLRIVAEKFNPTPVPMDKVSNPFNTLSSILTDGGESKFHKLERQLAEASSKILRQEKLLIYALCFVVKDHNMRLDACTLDELLLLLKDGSGVSPEEISSAKLMFTRVMNHA